MTTQAIVAGAGALGKTASTSTLLALGTPAVVAVAGCFCVLGVVAIVCNKQLDVDILHLRFTVWDGS